MLKLWESEVSVSVSINSILSIVRLNEVGKSPTEEQRVAGAFLSLWPGKGETLSEYRRRPSCASCRAELAEVFSTDPGRTKAFLKQINPDFEGEVTPLAGQSRRGRRSPFAMAGEVREIDDSPTAYKELFNEIKIQNGRYQGLSVSSLLNGRVKVYFY